MTTKYSWPSSALSAEEMHLLYKKKQRTLKPINLQIKEAVQKYIKEEE